MRKVIVLLVMLCSGLVMAQERGAKNDIIVTKNGELIQAKVVKVTENAISFSYPGETVLNEVATSSLEKIVFSSGRTQTFAKGARSTQSQQPLAVENEPIPDEEIYLGPESNYTENQLTVLPLSYIKNGVHDKKMSNQMTSFVTAFMDSNAKPYGITVPEMTQTIDKLVSADIGYQKLGQATPAELRDVLGSEYILKATLKDDRSSGQASRDLYSDNNTKTLKTTISIQLELYGADQDEEKYQVTFSEDIALNQAATSLEGKWKSSIKYVLQQLLSSRSL
ncbi:hypothetical protein [Poritiphilus flavus]|uniref:Uncharacterized protein n=1 Tax=Poritiphilus flavus TaxID=2697053 RepID=A0A6L9EES2_9FLAO|nr:hypothetical protein [Poritiphilus flavus]NAS13153.1 hypothetical protein [Poritiphilus flavus]